MRTIVHWDGDSFFASIEQASDGRLRRRPVVVGGERRGVVLSASGEARRLGIRPGWPVSRARRAVPALVVMPAHFELYERFFDEILYLCQETTPLVEPASVGAAWLDLTGAGRALKQAPEETVTKIRSTVRDWLKVTISAGIGTNKLVARVAARVRKPGAQIVVPPGRERAFLAPLPLRWLPGLEGGALSALEVAGIRSIGQFAVAPVDALASLLGKGALRIQRRAQGISEEPVGRKKAAEPGWAETVEFEEDMWDRQLIDAALSKLGERLMAQVRAGGSEVRRIALELKYTDRDESRRQADTAEPVSLDTEVLPLLPGLLEGAWTRRVRLRAMTLRATRVYRPSPQMDLFTDQAPQREDDVKLASAIDRLRKIHGEGIVQRGWALGKKTA
jgi:DNA polymerase-4